ncbi:MAG: DNA N-6-adenine-methyltransferase [Planctomycetota bacterium]
MTDNQELVPATGPLDVPAVVDSASRALADAVERGDTRAVKAIHDQAEALERLVKEMLKHNKKASENLRKLNELAKLRIVAAREMGGLLLQIVQRGGSRYRGATLQKAGVSRNQSSKFQRVAKLGDMAEAYIEDCNFREEEASLAGYMRFARNQPHFSSESDEWYTPEHMLRAVEGVLGAIHTDPCSNTGEPNVPAKVHFTEADDGLRQEWGGTVFMNPPYGRTLINWVRKLQSEIKDGHTQAAIALLPARPGSDWFKEIADRPVCFLQGRLRFSEGNPAPFPSMCVYFGEDIAKFIQVFRPLGCLFQPVKAEGAR